MNIENNINILGNFCGMRDVDRLSAMPFSANTDSHRQMSWCFLAVA